MACSASVTMSDVAAQIGASDCEELGGGLLAQPVNAVTSFAYVVVGAVVVVAALRRGRPTLDAWVFGVLLAAIGLGSVAFHGPQPGGARVLHDLPITLTVLYIVAVDLSLLRNHRPSQWRLFVPAAVAATVVTLVDVEAGTAITGLGVIAVVVLEFLVTRRNLRGLADRTRRRWSITLVTTAVIAGATWILGRTDSPACDPDGVFQFHGLWHVLSGILFGVWWLLAAGSLSRPVEREAVRAG